MEHKSIYQLVLAGILCAIGLVVPMVMPKVILGPMSFTLGSHVAIFLAMFISPKVAAAVVLGTTVGFFMTTPIIIAMRAASHIIFALVGALIIKHHTDILEKPLACLSLNAVLALLLLRLYVYSDSINQWLYYECCGFGRFWHRGTFLCGLQYFCSLVEMRQEHCSRYQIASWLSFGSSLWPMYVYELAKHVALKTIPSFAANSCTLG